MKYEVNGWFKHSEEDSFEHGCLSNTAYAVSGKERFIGASIEALLQSLNEFTGNNDKDAVELDACDETGRVDIQVTETEQGHVASPNEIAAWYRGEKRLWSAYYTFHVERVERVSVQLAA